MDRETRAFAESHFRRLRGQPGGGAGAPPGRVDFIASPASFSYADFLKRYLLPNVPCVFSCAFTEAWGARRCWVTPGGRPDFQHLLRTYGDAVVPVADCGRQEYNAHPKEHMLLRDYLRYWAEHIESGYSSPRGCLYLKDWHLCRDSSVEDVFTLPVYFSSDWLNEYWDALDVDDYRFVYMGPAGSCHQYPRRGHCSPALELTQEAGEMVFVPSGWHHQVHNLEDTISINHNWVNGCNLANMWHFLQQELRAVQQEVSQWRETMPDWHHHCQVIMKSCTGINFEEFYHFLKVIAERRLLLLAEGTDSGAMEGGAGSGLGPHQAAFDVSRITEVLASVVAHPDFQKVDTGMSSPQPEELLQQLEEVVASTASL
ncbi:2-oxoglutarate and iron-dependent oxygenase JMJD4 isoform X4 [Meles meles]|uniref:2-oxoglutarate and iron-dependent oxygenase JMJD4 isoform X4 n=1 Tax=Meles meles TaxID=9662 RepID=UPI001E69E048|nr:2-oxoglutarate and iron-dependent oxygenase JMJD4 isoform X4 [Meles meles]